jgi:hypothetical protein
VVVVRAEPKAVLGPVQLDEAHNEVAQLLLAHPNVAAAAVVVAPSSADLTKLLL